MKALTLTQPWASLVAFGEKMIETRSWATRHRGWIAIHAAKGFPSEARYFADQHIYTLRAHGAETDTLPRGSIVAVANLSQCYDTSDGRLWALIRKHPDEAVFGNYAPGRFGFVFDAVHALPHPVPCRGMLGFWEVPLTTEHEVHQQLGWRTSSHGDSDRVTATPHK